MQSTQPQEYRIAPELRRCCWYTILGAAVLVGVFYGRIRFVQNRGQADIAIGYVLFALMAAAMALPLRWKLRLDWNGVSRRLLFRWDVWRWSDLASGRVSKLHPYTLYDSTRSWWRRKIRLEYMASDDIQAVISAINSHYRLPPPPDVPDILTIKYGFRRSATFDNNGIHLSVGDLPHEYMWGDIQHVHITRMDAVRHDFKSLVIVFPHHEIELKLVTHQGGTSPTWRGASSEEINEFLSRNVALERIETTIAGEPLTKRKQIEKKLEATKKRTREIAIMMAVVLPLIVGLLVWMAIDGGVLKAVMMGAAFAIFPGSVMVFVYRSQRKQISDLIELLNSVVLTDPHPLHNDATEQIGEPERLHCRPFKA